MWSVVKDTLAYWQLLLRDYPIIPVVGDRIYIKIIVVDFFVILIPRSPRVSLLSILISRLDPTSSLIRGISGISLPSHWCPSSGHSGLFSGSSSVTTAWYAMHVIDLLEPAGKRHDDQNDQQQPDYSAWAVAPSAAIGPRRNRTEQQQDEHDNQDGRHLKHLWRH